MDNELNQLEAQTDITRLLEKFNQDSAVVDFSFSRPIAAEKNEDLSAEKQEKYQKSFEKLEEKIRELEEKFEASTAQNEAVMKELARTREAVENQKSKDAFFANITTTIANLKESVENLSRAQQAPRLYDPAPVPNRMFDSASNSFIGEYGAMAAYQPASYRLAQQSKLQQERAEKEKALTDLGVERLAKEQIQQQLYSAEQAKEKALADLQLSKQEKEQTVAELNLAREEKTRSEMAVTELRNSYEEKVRFISSLHQKASQLKAVNVALDREIKRVQQEKVEALRKSAEQAKEILSLRDALTAAEERFKSFDFEGRIISIKRQYQQKVTTLENQLHEISNTCMKQVEEIESLKAENLKLHKIAEEKEQLAALYEAKTRELEALRVSVAQLRASKETINPARLAAFTSKMQRLQQEHENLSVRLSQAQEALTTVTAEKKTLENNFKALLSKIEQNDAVIEKLKQKIIVLTDENRQLKNRPAVKAPTVQPVKEPVTVRQPVPSAKTGNTIRTAAAKTVRESLPEPEAAPVGMQNTMRPKVQTEADLPEIRVADPVPQPQPFEGEDFLTKTDSFIGRMKWSIFKEDK